MTSKVQDMQDVLTAILALFYEGCDRHYHAQLDEHYKQMIESVLAKPSRNCEVGTVEEQMYRFRSHCDRQGDCVECPIRQETIGRALFCGIAWSQKPYKQKEGAK